MPTEAEFLDKTQTIVLRVFLLAFHNLDISISHTNSYKFYNSAAAPPYKGERRKT